MTRRSEPSGVVLSHPTLNANVRAAALALAEAGMLGELHTSIAVGERLAAVASVQPALSRTLEKRRVPPVVATRSHSHPAYELRRALAKRFPSASGLLGDPGLHGMYAAIDAVAAGRVDERTSAVLAYEDGALATFAAAERFGVPRVYDLPIPFWRTTHALLQEEAEANPAWAPLLGALSDPGSVLQRKSAELEAADLVLCASSLSARSVRDALPDKPLVQIAYGCPSPAEAIRPASGAPLKVLYVGSLTQRKGLSYLFDAMSMVGSARLTVVGRGAPAPSRVLDRALAEHTHLSAVPHQSMAAVMRQHDVLVLPSLVEGFGLVINEALAQGVPVLATDRTGLVDLLAADPQDWIVPAASSEAIAARLERWTRDADALNEAKTAALETARRHPWSDYRSELVETLRRAIDQDPRDRSGTVRSR